MQKRDFSKRRTFPGTHNNDFDILLRFLDQIQRLPAPLFLALGLLGAWIATLFQWERALILWLFILFDWLLLALLPRLGKSFGPANPPTAALAILRGPWMLLPEWLAIPIQVIGTALVFYAFYLEPHRLTVTRQTLRSPKLIPGQPIKVLHLGDLHIERITDRERQLLQLLPQLNPDLILFSGDFLNLSYLRDPLAQADCRRVLAQMRAPLGVYAVTGSPAVDLPEVVPGLLDGLAIHWLRDERVTVTKGDQAIEIIGLSCTHKPFVDAPRLAQLLGPARGAAPFTVLLYHAPDLAPDVAELGLDLQLSGHTHGGQVRLPFYGALITASLYGKALEVGRKQLGGLTLYVTRGIGLEGAGAPRARFLCPPEIILWELDG